MFNLYQERFPGNQWKPLQPVAFLVRMGELVKIYYEDGTFRLIEYIQDLLEQRIGRELMRHEYAWVPGVPIDLKPEDVVLMVSHPDWPERQEPSEIARPLVGHKRAHSYVHKTDRRAYIDIHYFDGSVKSTSLSRFLYEDLLGRQLTKSEQVDHINNDPTNDSVENFQILSPQKNIEKAAVLRGYSVGEDMYGEYVCLCCQTAFKRLKRDVRDTSAYCSRSCASKSKIQQKYPDGVRMVDVTCMWCRGVFQKKWFDYEKSMRHYGKVFCSKSCAIRNVRSRERA